jgi:hypothetical protein
VDWDDSIAQWMKEFDLGMGPQQPTGVIVPQLEPDVDVFSPIK